MSEKKGLGSRLLGVFVEAPEVPGEGVARDESDLGSGSPPLLDPASPAPPPLPPTTAASTDFEAVFREAGMDVSELDRVKKAEELLKGLPAETPLAVKKQIVEASLRAFGFEVDKIVSAAQNQHRALDAYVRANESGAAKANAEAETQVKALTEKIATLRADSDRRRTALAGLAAAAQARKADVQRVIDFFLSSSPQQEAKKQP